MSKTTLEGQICLDVFWMNRNIFPIYNGLVTWSNGFGNKIIFEIYLNQFDNYLNICSPDKEFNVFLEKTSCYFGGFRSWLVCPICKYKKAKLYFVRGYLACRNCLGLTYSSVQLRRSRTESLWRAVRQAIKYKDKNARSKQQTSRHERGKTIQ